MKYAKWSTSSLFLSHSDLVAHDYKTMFLLKENENFKNFMWKNGVGYFVNQLPMTIQKNKFQFLDTKQDRSLKSLEISDSIFRSIKIFWMKNW